MKVNVGILHQSLALTTVTCNAISFGLATGWTAPTIYKLQHPSNATTFTITPNESSWIASIEHFGNVFGILTTLILLDVIGRRPLIICCSLSYFLSWVCIPFTESALQICFLRFTTGFASGLNEGTNSAYIGEISSPTLRNVFGIVITATDYLGTVLEFVVATCFSYTQTAVVNAIITSLALCSTLLLVEAPQFLLMKGKKVQAWHTFMWLRGGPPTTHFQNEFQKIEQNVADEVQRRSSLRKRLTSRANYRSLFIVCILYLLVGASGNYTIVAYASTLFTPIGRMTANEFTILFGFLQVVIVVTTSFIIQRFNRRSVVLSSFAMAAALNASTAVLYYLHYYRDIHIPHFPWLIFTTVTGYACIFAFVYPAVFLIRAELFPLSIKAIGNSISMIGISASIFLMTYIFVFVDSKYGVYCNFVIFAIVNVLIVIFSSFVLPETRNKSLIEIQEILEGPKTAAIRS